VEKDTLKKYLIPIAAAFLLPFAAGEVQASAGESDSTRLHEEAKALIEKGDYGEAMKVEKRWQDLEPNNPLPHDGLAVIHINLGHKIAAETEARIAVSLAPKDPRFHYLLGWALQNAGQMPEALQEFNKAAELEPKNQNAKLGAASCLLALHREKEAVELMEQLNKEHPNDKRILDTLAQAYLDNHDTFGADATADRALSLFPDDYQAITIKAEISEAQFLMNRARLLAKRLVTLQPKNPSGYKFVIHLAVRENDNHPLAIWVLQQAQLNIPDNLDVFSELAAHSQEKAQKFANRPRSKNGSPEKQLVWLKIAEAAFTQLVRIKPDDPRLQLALAQVLLDEGRGEDAFPHALQAHQKMPGNAQADEAYRQCLSYRNDLAMIFKRWLYSGRTEDTTDSMPAAK
jgi:Flp pilus assembly protein TadD